MNFGIGSFKSCFIYKEQEKCIADNLGKFFERNGPYDNASLVFDAGDNDHYKLNIPSEILPLNWSLYIHA